MKKKNSNWIRKIISLIILIYVFVIEMNINTGEYNEFNIFSKGNYK